MAISTIKVNGKNGKDSIKITIKHGIVMSDSHGFIPVQNHHKGFDVINSSILKQFYTLPEGVKL